MNMYFFFALIMLLANVSIVVVPAGGGSRTRDSGRRHTLEYAIDGIGF